MVALQGVKGGKVAGLLGDDARDALNRGGGQVEPRLTELLSRNRSKQRRAPASFFFWQTAIRALHAVGSVTCVMMPSASSLCSSRSRRPRSAKGTRRGADTANGVASGRTQISNSSPGITLIIPSKTSANSEKIASAAGSWLATCRGCGWSARRQLLDALASPIGC